MSPEQHRGATMRMILAFMLIMPQTFPNAQEKKLDGYWWTGIENEIGGNKTMAQYLRVYFLSGFKRGLSKAKEAEVTYDIILKDTRYLKDVKDINKVSDALLRVTIDQYESGLSQFYQDYKNKQIEVVDAMDIVAMEIGGQSSEEIEWKTRYYRADEEMRSIMLKEKYKDLYK